MAGHSDLVTHENTISRLSPFLFLSLILITWNMFFTLIGVLLNDFDPMVNEEIKNGLYGVSLGVFPFFCVASMIVKYCFSCCYAYQIHTPKQLLEAIILDVIFVSMGTLYLVGDNLPVFICSSMQDETIRLSCRRQSSIILGVSLLLFTTLYLAGTLKTTSSRKPTFPVTGKIRKGYQSVLQLAALTIFLDQTFSTVVRYFTSVELIEDIETAESQSCGCLGNASVVDCLLTFNGEVGGFFASLSSILIIIVIWLLAKHLKDYCSCCTLNMKSMTGECCCHLWEDFCIIFFHFFAVVFMVLYTLGDNRWLWKCVPMIVPPSIGRVTMLSIALSFSFMWIIMYVFIICLPGIGIVQHKMNSKFRECESMTIKINQNESEWMCESFFAQYAVSQPPPNSKPCCCSCLSGSPTREESVGMATISQHTHVHDLTSEIRGKITVVNNFGALAIALPSEENISCQKGLNIACCQCQECCTPCWNFSKRTCKRLWNFSKCLLTSLWGCFKKLCIPCCLIILCPCIPCGIFFLFCLCIPCLRYFYLSDFTYQEVSEDLCILCFISPFTSCFEYIKSLGTTCWEWLNKEEVSESDNVLFIYKGLQENIKTATLSSVDGKLEFTSESQSYPTDTQLYWVIKKPKMFPVTTNGSETIEASTGV